MHESRRRAAEQHELAANAHRTAAEYYEKGGSRSGSLAFGAGRRVLGSRLQASLQRKPTPSLEG
jgi:hypothetical protein